MRRAFTLLELTLAVAVGLLVLGVALAMFRATARADARQETRFEHESELSRLHRVIGAAMTSLLVEETQATPGAAPPPSGDAPENPEDEPAVRPRALLAKDEFAGVPNAPSPSTGFEPMAMNQRLELTLLRAPVRDLSGAKRETSRNDQSPALLPASSDRPSAANAGVRGVLELRPQIDPRTGVVELDSRGRRLFAMWWREFPPPPEALARTEGEDEPAALPAKPPIEIARDLTYVRWRVFFDGEHEDEHAALGVLDLPAYVTMQVEASSGPHADWLFEIGWNSGPDPHEPPEIEEDPNAGQEAEVGQAPEAPSRPAARPARPAGRERVRTPQRPAPRPPAQGGGRDDQ